MAHINLLPWREQQREARKRAFLAMMALMLGLAALLVFLGDLYFSSEIERQQSRNNFMKREIATLDKRIKEISELQKQKAALLERMEIIQNLQGDRPITTHVFDQLVRTMPEGAFYTLVSLKGALISMTGVAESNNKVSALMRNLDASEWLDAPNLTEVKALDPKNRAGGNAFKLTVKQVRPQIKKAEDEQ